MEFIFEYLAEVVVECLGEAACSSKVPRPFRILIAVAVGLFFLALLGLFLYLLVVSQNFLEKAIMGLAAALLVVLLIFFVRKVIKKL